MAMRALLSFNDQDAIDFRASVVRQRWLSWHY
jgi:hypothetical protein